MPTISVIVPVYKVEPYLRRCVDSILQQTYTDFELILVDDGSPDGCPALCDEYAAQDSRVTVIHQPNGGLSAARNAGIDWAFAHSDSQWLAFIDSDDWVHPQYLGTLHNAITQFDADTSIIWKENVLDGTEPTSIFEEVEPYLIDNREACHRIDYGETGFCYATAWAKLYRKNLWESIRFPVGKLFEDTFTTHRILYSAKKVAIAETPAYYYRLRNSSICGSSFTLKKLDRLAGYQARAEFYREHGETELFHQTEVLLAHGISADYYHCLVELHDDETAERLKKSFVEVFDSERRNMPFWPYHECWCLRYPAMGVCRKPIGWIARICLSIKHRGVRGSWKRFKEKIARK